MSDQPHPGTTESRHPDAEPPADRTLGGSYGHHDRPPAFEGSDGYPYTVSLEVERTPNLEAPFSGYLVFPRWAENGVGIIGHLETPLLFHGRSKEEIVLQLEALTLLEVSDHLRAAITRRQQEND